MNTLLFGKGSNNFKLRKLEAKLGKKVFTFSLPAGCLDVPVYSVGTQSFGQSIAEPDHVGPREVAKSRFARSSKNSRNVSIVFL